MSRAMPFTFEQLGGRCKLADEALSRPSKRVTAYSPQVQEATRRQVRLEEQRDVLRRRLHWKQVEDFLGSHGFQHVNDVKLMWCGLRRTYPLRVAVKECEWGMVQLLKEFGAKIC